MPIAPQRLAAKPLLELSAKSDLAVGRSQSTSRHREADSVRADIHPAGGVFRNVPAMTGVVGCSWQSHKDIGFYRLSQQGRTRPERNIGLGI
jgi:hypothetical protein